MCIWGSSTCEYMDVTSPVLVRPHWEGASQYTVQYLPVQYPYGEWKAQTPRVNYCSYSRKVLETRYLP